MPSVTIECRAFIYMQHVKIKPSLYPLDSTNSNALHNRTNWSSSANLQRQTECKNEKFVLLQTQRGDHLWCLILQQIAFWNSCLCLTVNFHVGPTREKTIFLLHVLPSIQTPKFSKKCNFFFFHSYSTNPNRAKRN